MESSFRTETENDPFTYQDASCINRKRKEEKGKVSTEEKKKKSEINLKRVLEWEGEGEEYRRA